MCRSLVDLDYIIAKPLEAPVPREDNIGTLYALSAALARRADKGNFGNILKYADRIPSEFNMYLVRDALRRDASLTGVREYGKWIIRHQDTGGWDE